MYIFRPVVFGFRNAQTILLAKYLLISMNNTCSDHMRAPQSQERLWRGSDSSMWGRERDRRTLCGDEARYVTSASAHMPANVTPDICREQRAEKWAGGEAREEPSVRCCRDKHRHTLYSSCTDVVMASVIMSPWSPLLVDFADALQCVLFHMRWTGNVTLLSYKKDKSHHSWNKSWVNFCGNLSCSIISHALALNCLYTSRGALYSNVGWVLTSLEKESWRLYYRRRSMLGFDQNAQLLLNGHQWREM